MIIQTQEELEALQRVGAVVAETIRVMGERLVPGITTIELDQIGQKILESHGAQSAPKLTYNFPGYTCISVNQEVAHGVPGYKIVDEGDIVNIDVSAELNGFYADAGRTFTVGSSKFKTKKLLSTTQQALRSATSVLRVGQPLSIIGKAIEKASGNFSIIKNLGSHGVGSALHEYPQDILPFFTADETRLLEEGMVITIEPFLTTHGDTVVHRGEWVLINPNPTALNAQFENTIVVTKNGPIIITQETK